MQGWRAKLQRCGENSAKSGNIFDEQLHKICSMATDFDEQFFGEWNFG